jgi:hypothetical protein
MGWVIAYLHTEPLESILDVLLTVTAFAAVLAILLLPAMAIAKWERQHSPPP